MGKKIITKENAAFVVTLIQGWFGLVHAFQEGEVAGHAYAELCAWCHIRKGGKRQQLARRRPGST